MSRVAIVTGATRNLGLALVQQLAQRLQPDDVVYLTGPDASRVEAALGAVGQRRASLRGEVIDVSDADAVSSLAARLADRHGGVDIVFSNAYRRTDPIDEPSEVIERYVAVNNLGTTAVLRSFLPRLRDGGCLFVVASTMGTLHYLPPVLHRRFERPATLGDVDHEIRAWRDAVRGHRAAAEAWPAWINIPSKVGQVAAVRVAATEWREEHARRGMFLAAVCPGLIDTGASRPWFREMGQAQTAEQAAGPLIELALGRYDRSQYGQLLRFGKVVPWAP